MIPHATRDITRVSRSGFTDAWRDSTNLSRFCVLLSHANPLTTSNQGLTGPSFDGVRLSCEADTSIRRHHNLTVDSQGGLQQKWIEWALGNLGRDPKLVAIAAKSATDAVQLGKGFNDAAEAARVAWAEASKEVDSERITSVKADGTGRRVALGLGLGGGCAMALGAVVAFVSFALSAFAVADVCTPGRCQADPELAQRANIAVIGQFGGFAAGLIAAIGGLPMLRWFRTGAVLLVASALVAVGALSIVFMYYPISPASVCWQGSWCDAPYVAGSWLLPRALLVWAAAFVALRRWLRGTTSSVLTAATQVADNPIGHPENQRDQ